jgi:phosphoribosylglycinamide formyltransferase 2
MNQYPRFPVIGTPLTSNAIRVMMLGSGELGKEVIIELQRLGVEVIAVDRYPNAPGHQVAHRAYVIDMTDGQALRDLVAKEKPHLIVPEIEAIATKTLMELEQEGVVEVIPTARAAYLTMNREGIRELAAKELGLPTSPYFFASSLEQLQAAIDNGIGYPCFVKPVMSSSGKGQSKLDGPQDVKTAWEFAASGGRVDSGRVIVEGLIDFDYEITLLTVRSFGTDGTIKTSFCEPIGHVQKNGDYVESWQPMAMSSLAIERARDIAEKITSNFGGRGIFGVELFVKGDQVWFSEVSPRPHDTGLVTLVSQVQSEFELHAKAILGLPTQVTLKTPGASAVIYGGIEAIGIGFENVHQALSQEGVTLRLFGKPESFIKRRMGVALASAANTELAREHAKEAAQTISTVQL